MKRRDFILGAAAFPFVACAPKTEPPLPPGDLGGMDLARGHRLRSRDFPAPGETRRTGILIVGAGIGGLSAAWQLQRSGCDDFAVLELEDAAGGNARHGQNEVSAYPLGAHYLPLPPPEATTVRALLADLGVLHGDPQALLPSYDERYLCHAPQERLFVGGFWQEGLMPRLGVPAAERRQIERFQGRMAELKAAQDGRGRRAFALPAALSSPDLQWRALDRITLRQWLLDNGFDAPHLHWYADYACRDDFGTDYAQTSAWAGLHYFACRNGAAANAAPDAVLTAPEGNGWIVKRLAERLGGKLAAGNLVWRLAQTRRGVEADVWLAAENRCVRFVADAAIWAAPLYVLARAAEGLPATLAQLAAAAGYAPWIVANLTLTEPPAPGAGAPLSWDNVIYGGAGLGYVVATHQGWGTAPGPTVLTYYRALADLAPAAARAKLATTSREAWAGEILADLGRAHADLRVRVTRLDVFRHGHAMIRPLPGVIHDPARLLLARGWGRVRFAHADVSGLSLFEEANYRGVEAADGARRLLRV